TVGADGKWQPAPYDCDQSRDQPLRRDVEVLDAQLGAIAQAHPGAAFHLVGFSLGGLVAFGEIGRLATVDNWIIGGGGRLATVVTLDSPLGGAPFVDEVCALAPDICGGAPIPEPDSVLRDFSAIWGSGARSPAGGRHSVLAALSSQAGAASPVITRGNQALAMEAAGDHGVKVLTV